MNYKQKMEQLMEEFKVILLNPDVDTGDLHGHIDEMRKQHKIYAFESDGWIYFDYRYSELSDDGSVMELVLDEDEMPEIIWLKKHNIKYELIAESVSYPDFFLCFLRFENRADAENFKTKWSEDKAKLWAA